MAFTFGTNTAVSRGVNPVLTAIPGLTGTYAWPQIVINAGGQITAITSLTTFTGVLTVVGQINATNTAGGVAAIFSTPSDTQVQINASGTGQFSTLQFTQAGVLHGQLFSDNTNGFMELTVNNGTGGFKISQGAGPIVGVGPISGAFVDMTPDRGTFTLTHTGFNAAVTSTATWYRIGKVVTVNTGGVSGTSNATTWTATGLPAGIQSSLQAQTITIGDAENNGAGVAATVTVSASSGTLTFGNGFTSGGAWTNSGAKGFFNSGGTTFSYLMG